MVYVKTRFSVVDNSGALISECIKVLRKKNQQGTVSDIVIVAVKSAKPRKKVKKHNVQRGVIVRTKKRIHRNYIGYTIYFDRNSIILIDKKNNPIANRIKGSVCQELRYKKFMKIVSMAASVI